MDVAKRYGGGSEMLVFQGKRGRKTVQKVKTTTAVPKYYGFERRTSITSEKVFVSQERVSGFPEKGADLRGSPGTSGEVWGTSGEVRETSGEPLDCC